jgi:hypothetical protein
MMSVYTRPATVQATADKAISPVGVTPDVRSGKRRLTTVRTCCADNATTLYPQKLAADRSA